MEMTNPADDIPQSERRRVMANDRMATYHSVAQSAVDDERGARYATKGNKQTAIRSSPIAYPPQPSTSPWHSDPCPPEPPLGFDVNAIDPVGEPHEIKASEGSPPSSSVRRKFRRRI
jgi:hypothetical protein